jgi:hypothetical protein
MNSARIWLLFCIAASASTAFAQPEPPAASFVISGTYTGKLTFTKGGRGMDSYDYKIVVSPFNAETGKIAIKATSDFYPSKDIKLGNCEPGDSKTSVTFVCKGKDGWHEDFEVSGSSLKGSGVTKKNYPYFISATKVTNQAE